MNKKSYRAVNAQSKSRVFVAGIGAFLVLGAGLSSAARAAAPATEEADTPLLEIVVVGTHFATPNAGTISPVMVLDAEELSHQGTSRVEDLLDSMPQLNGGLNNSDNGTGVLPLTGTATADLRGIGSFNTLVLMNSRRLNPGDSINPSPDLNTIPSVLIKRVEILTGGASSIYGSDAISGVVNFVMDTDYTGAKLETEYGLNRAGNDNVALQNIMRSSGISPRSSSLYDGRNLDLTGVYGTDLFGGSGHVVGYAGYRHSQGVYGSSRDFSACTLQETGSSYSCLLDGTTTGGQFAANNGAGPSLTLDPATGNTFRPFDLARDGFNPAPYQTLARPDARYTAGFFGRYTFNEKASAYVEGTFADDHTSVLYESAGTTPTGSGLNTFNVNCNNPLLSASQVTDLCTSAGLLNPTDVASVAIGQRNAGGALREDDFRHRSYRMLVGVKGEINDVWNYDFNGQYGNTDSHERLSNDISQTKLARALNVVGVNGVPTCQSVVDGTDPNCVPYNIFSAGAVTPAALRYIAENGAQDGRAHQYVFDGKFIGQLGKYGIKSPLAEAGVDFAAGVEYRSQTISNQPNAAYLSGDLLVTGEARSTLGTYHVSEAFSELRIPLLENRPFAKSLTLNVSDRYAQYSPQGGANAYNFGLEWAPVDLIRARGTVSRAVRAPNGHELFLSQSLSQVLATDPCAGTTPTASRGACANSGVTPGQYGNIAPASTFNQVTGGNPNLKPQTADTVTAGLVFTPLAWAPSMLLSVDYWRIKVKHYIGSLASVDSLNNCLNTGDPVYCNLVHRDANGSLSVGNGPTAGRVIATGENTGSFEMSGIDIDGRYVMDTGKLWQKDLGRISFNFAGSVALDNIITVVPGQPAFDCTGLYGPTCTGEGPTSPIPKWRHKLRTTWEVFKGFEVSVNWRHLGSLSSEQTSSNPHLATGTAYPVDSQVPSYDYVDFDTGFDLGSHVSLRLGVNNLFDRQAPIVGFNANPLLVNGNMLSSVYDTFGRYLFVGLTARY